MVMHIANRSSPRFMALMVLAVFLGGCGNRESAQPGGERRSVLAPGLPRSKFIPTQADIARFLEEGKEPTLRRIAAVDYFLQYQMLRATGTEQALGGDENAMAALLALGNAYERRVRVLDTELPTMLRRVAFTGDGMSSGFTGMGLGWLTGMLTGGMTSGMVSTMTDAQLEEWRRKGPLKYDGKDAKAEINVGKDGSISQAMELEVNEGGINGKVKMKLRIAACPDVNDRVEVEIDVDSQMSVIDKPGSGGYVQSTFKYERYLDDDAHLIDSAGGSASSNHIRMGGFAVWGHGVYTVNYQDDVAVSLVAQGPGNVKTPHGTMSRNGSETYTLTPREKSTCIDPAN